MLVKLVYNHLFKEKFLVELNENKQILLKRINLFLKEAKEVGLKVFNSQGGFFLSVPCDNPPFVYEKLREQNIYIIPLQSSIRIAICSISVRETIGLARKIKDVIDEQ